MRVGCGLERANNGRAPACGGKADGGLRRGRRRGRMWRGERARGRGGAGAFWTVGTGIYTALAQAVGGTNQGGLWVVGWTEGRTRCGRLHKGWSRAVAGIHPNFAVRPSACNLPSCRLVQRCNLSTGCGRVLRHAARAAARATVPLSQRPSPPSPQRSSFLSSPHLRCCRLHVGARRDEQLRRVRVPPHGRHEQRRVSSLRSTRGRFAHVRGFPFQTNPAREGETHMSCGGGR